MQGKKGKQNNGILLAAFLLLVFAGTWQLTKMTPLVGDDFNYAFSWADDTRVDNFTLVVKSMISHRQWTHGRVFAQGWVTLFMMWPKQVFNLANAAVVIAFFAALFHFFRRTETRSPVGACAVVAALYWICMPVFGQVFLWLDGACNYFWGAAFAWILLELTWTAKNSRYAVFWAFLLLPLAFAVGAWSEHISFAFLAILFLSLIADWVRRKKLPIVEVLILLVSCAGYLFLMFAPSMLPSTLKNRATDAASSHFQTIKAFLIQKWWVPVLAVVILITAFIWLKRKKTWRSRWIALSLICVIICFTADLIFSLSALRTGGVWGLVSSTQAGFLTLMGCFFVCLKKTIQDHASRDRVYGALIIAFGGLCALIPFSVAMYIPARGFCAPIAFVTISTVMLWTAVEHPNSKRKWNSVALLVGLFLLSFIPGIWDLAQTERAAEAREQAIEQALESDGVLYASPYPEKTKYSAQYGIQDLAEGEYWPNAMIIKYYGLKDIIVMAAEPTEVGS